MKKYFAVLMLMAMAACSEGEANTEKITVASEMADCVGVTLQKCLLVKPEGEKDWQFWYNPIEGFEYESGYEYVLRVRKVGVDNPPADASSVKLVLDKVLSKKQKTSDNIPDTSHIRESLGL